MALAVAVGVVASTGTAGMSWASARSEQGEERSSGFSAADIILGFMGEGVVAKYHPELALVPGEVVGATSEEVAVFLKLASQTQPKFAEEFHADVTSGDPYRVRDGLERLDATARVLGREITEPGTGSGVVSLAVTNKVLAVNVAVVANLAVAVTKLVFRQGFEEGESGLTTEKAVAIVTKLLAGK